MKFFDDINIEKLNSLLKFKTRDNNFKIKGSIELYTMKNTIKEKKTVVKRINDFLDEKYKETFITNEIMKQQEQRNESAPKGAISANTSINNDSNDFGKDFYEQKRRLSVTSDYYSGNNAGNNSSAEADEGIDNVTKNSPKIGSRRPSSTGSLPPNKKRRSSSSTYSLKLNDENLNKIINDTEYFMKMRMQNSEKRRGSLVTDCTDIPNTSDGLKIEEEQIDFKNFDFQMGPFGNISDPQARKLFSQIIMILNSSFQDHDFVKIISPLDFKELSLDAWQTEFNNIIDTDVPGIKRSSSSTDVTLDASSAAKDSTKEQVEKNDDAFVPPNTEKLTGFNSGDLWNILNNKIDLGSCFKIIEYSPSTQDNKEEQGQFNKVVNETNRKEQIVAEEKQLNEVEDELKLDRPQINKKDFLKDELENNDGSYVWSKLWFLINKKMKRVAFISIICSRTAADQSDLSDEGQYYVDEEDVVVDTSDEESGYEKKKSDPLASDFNGDYDDSDDEDLEYAIESDDESE
ncbi:hypothetical protein QEN19_003581 [Hanseniaspora menglaensis]